MNATSAAAVAAAWLHDDGQALTRAIQETWAEVLELDRVGPHDDFFELGGHSLIVAHALARLNERLGLDLPPRAVFAAPTPAEMAELIADHRGKRRGALEPGISPFVPEWIIPLQREGEGRPVFVFPAGHNEVAALAKEAQIAAHVGRRHPFWGFRREDPQLDGIREHGLPMLAAEYMRQIRTLQPEGPYLLLGNCEGGYHAWEVARQLLALGEEIAGILFYEVPLRSDFDRPIPGITPALGSHPWHLSLTYRPQALPVDLTHILTTSWHARGWWAPWQRVALGTVETALISDLAPDFRARREALIAEHVRAWIARSEAGMGSAGASTPDSP